MHACRAWLAKLVGSGQGLLSTFDATTELSASRHRPLQPGGASSPGSLGTNAVVNRAELVPLSSDSEESSVLLFPRFVDRGSWMVCRIRASSPLLALEDAGMTGGRAHLSDLLLRPSQELVAL